MSFFHRSKPSDYHYRKPPDQTQQNGGKNDLQIVIEQLDDAVSDIALYIVMLVALAILMLPLWKYGGRDWGFLLIALYVNLIGEMPFKWCHPIDTIWRRGSIAITYRAKCSQYEAHNLPIPRTHRR